MATNDKGAKRAKVESSSIMEWDTDQPLALRSRAFARRVQPAARDVDDSSIDGVRLSANDTPRLERPAPSDDLIVEAARLSFATDEIALQVRTLASDLSGVDTEARVAPKALLGELILPTGAPGAGLAVSLRRRTGDPEPTRPADRRATDSITRRPAADTTPANGDSDDNGERDVPFASAVAVSDAGGRFSLLLDEIELPSRGLDLVVQGADTMTTIPLSRSVLATGRLGTRTLDRPLAPVSDSLRAELQDEGATPADTALRLGEDDCARRFSSNAGVIDRYRWSTLIRLVEPKVFPPQGKTDAGTSVPDEAATTLDALIYRDGASRMGMRVPIGAPIDVDRFRLDLETDPANVPKAGSIGLGYVLQMSQAWIPRGLSLGNLLYSLPLAPGEEQRVIVSESIERLTVRERERTSLRQRQSQTDQVARTTSQLFGSALQDAASGGSSFESESSSSQVGGGFSILGFGLSGGGSWSSTDGSSSSWQRSSRDFASWAAETFHSSLSRRAAISRQVSNVSVRLATLDDRDEVASKIISNRNRNHAMTLQYWEVMRNFTITSDVENVSLVCFVPLEIIPWTVPQTSDGPQGSLGSTITRAYLVERYSTVLRHADVLGRRLRFQPRLRRALKNVEALAANPMIQVDSDGEARRLSLRISASGTFLPFDQLSATVVTNAGRRTGPVRLTPASAEEPVAREAINRGDIVDALLARREDTSGAESTRAAHLVLPTSVSPADIARIEISHRITSWTYRPPARNARDPQDDGAIDLSPLASPEERRRALSFSARDITQLVGAPQVWDLEVESLDHEGETIAQDLTGSDSAVRMPARYVVSPDPEDPIFGREELQLAEELLTHLRENALRYSKAVWGDMTSDELVMMLEPNAIGLPLGNGTLSEVPLVSCIATSILGFFGNSMVLPFHIPAQMATETGTTSGEIEDRLMQFHRQAFRPPRTEVALPAGGMLGEAVLGACDSAEKIDLTRFWNWKDAPLPHQADDPNAVSFGAERVLGTSAAAGPSRLSSVAAPAYDINPAKLPDTALDLAKLLSALPASQLPTDLDASELAKTFAAQGLTNAGALATDVVEKIMKANDATGPSVSDLMGFLQAMETKAKEIKTDGLASFTKDPSSFAAQIGKAEPDKRDAMAKGMVGDLTGGLDLSAGEQAGVFSVLQGLGGGAAGGSAEAIGVKALLMAFGLPPL